MLIVNFTYGQEEGVLHDVVFTTNIGVKRVGQKVLPGSIQGELLGKLKNDALFSARMATKAFNLDFKPGPPIIAPRSYISQHSTIFEGLQITCDITATFKLEPESMDAIINFISRVQVHVDLVAVTVIHDALQNSHVVDLHTRKRGRP